jgi:F-type H+-transporting ATPase subunit b
MKHLNITYALAGIMLAHPALAEEGKGLPQMDTGTYASQLFWLFLCFTVLYLVMSKVSLPRVSETIEGRKNQKDGDLKQAATWNGEAEKIKTAYEQSLAKAQQTAAMSAASAEREMSGKASEEQAKFAENARKRLTTAEQNIAKAKADALNSLADIAADIAASMVEKVADVQVTKADAKKAVVAAMQES